MLLCDINLPGESGIVALGKLRELRPELVCVILTVFDDSEKLFTSLQAGAVGAILAFADAAPTACYEIFAAWKEGDVKLALLKQQRVAAAAQRVVGQLSIPGVKYAMDVNGYFGGPARLPLLPLTADLKAEIERLMGDIRN